MAETGEPKSRRDRPAKAPLSRASIVEGALGLVKNEGIESVTLRRVAELLDTGPASLYVYVANREDLLERMLDEVLLEVRPPKIRRGRLHDQLVQLYSAVLEVMDRYPGIAQVALGSIPTGPGALDITEHSLALLRANGISDQAAAWACDALLLFTTATSVEHAIERRRAPTSSQQKSDMANFVEATSARFASLSDLQYPNLVEMASRMTQGDDAERFIFGISALISGARDLK